MGNSHPSKTPSRLDAVLAEADKHMDEHINDHIAHLQNKMIEIEATTKQAVQVYQDERKASLAVDQIFWAQVYLKMTEASSHHIRLSKNENAIWNYLLVEFYRRGYQVEINHEKNEHKNYDCTIRWNHHK